MNPVRKFFKLAKWFPKWVPDNYPAYVVVRRKFENWMVKYTTSESFDSINFNDRDWDNLVILDACRYDIFEELNPFEQQAEAVYSNASHTHEFLEKNFSGDNLDTVYVTASPQVGAFGGNFAHVEHVWKDEWDEEENTVLPEKVTERALEIAERFPDKRLVVHYMQPHFPFIGSDVEQGSFRGRDRGREFPSIWEKAYAGDVELDTVRDDYRNNLEVVLPEVEKLAGSLEGKTVVTSDHGNIFGKKVNFLPFRIYGHPAGVKDPELNQVPWLELAFEDRKDVNSAGETFEEDMDEAEVKSKLEDLGYT